MLTVSTWAKVLLQSIYMTSCFCAQAHQSIRYFLHVYMCACAKSVFLVFCYYYLYSS